MDITYFMSLNDLLSRIEYGGNKREHSISTLNQVALSVAPDFFETEYLQFFAERRFAETYRQSVREMVINACEHGNRFDSSKHVTVTYFLGKEGILVEITDEGEGIPVEACQKIKKRNYYEKFLKGSRGRGYSGLNRNFYTGIIDDVEIEGTTIRLLKMSSIS